MPPAVAVVYVLLTAAIATLIWQQLQRQDRAAHVLGLAAPRRDSIIGFVVIVLTSGVMAIVPTLLVWTLLA
jgi:hypothetical protein